MLFLLLSVGLQYICRKNLQSQTSMSHSKDLSGSESSSDVFLKSRVSGILYLKYLAEGLSLPFLSSSPLPPHNPYPNKLIPRASMILLPFEALRTNVLSPSSSPTFAQNKRRGQLRYALKISWCYSVLP